jgi:hypothetical protein
MPATDLPARLLPYAEELLENEYARDNLRQGAEKLRDAYGRTQKRRVDSAKDGKLRGQLTAAVAALGEGTQALATGRQKPKRRAGKRLALLGGIVVAGAITALALNEGLRAQAMDLLGGDAPATGSGPSGGVTTTEGSTV